MKITKRQLKRIIKEESNLLLREQQGMKTGLAPGDEVLVQTSDGGEVSGKIVKLNPLKIRTDPTSVRVLPDAFIVNVQKMDPVTGQYSRSSMDEGKNKTKITKRQLKRIIREGLQDDLVDALAKSGIPSEHWKKMAGVISAFGLMMNPDVIALNDAIAIYEEKAWDASTKNIWEPK